MVKRKARLSEALKALVQKALDGITPARLAVRWNMDKDTLARALAGFEVNAGSIAEIELGLLRDRQKQEGKEAQP